jgi:integrase
MARNKLTAFKVQRAKPGPGGKVRMLSDGGNLWLQVKASKDGAAVYKSWIFRYALPGVYRTSKTGKQHQVERQMGLGNTDDISLEKAREAAQEQRLLLRAGKDPIDEKNAQRAAVLRERASVVKFRDAAERYLKTHQGEWKNEVHKGQWEKTLNTYVFPVIGDMPVNAITKWDILKILEPHWGTRRETMKRVRGRIEAILRSWRDPARLDVVKAALPTKRNRRDKKNLEAMAYSEIPAFMVELRQKTSLAARALELTILTAVRTNEALSAQWREVNFDAKIWTIPDDHTKRDKELVVPLSSAAIRVLRYLDDVRQGTRIFPIENPQAMQQLLRQMRPGETDQETGKVVPGTLPTVHGFRASFRSWAAKTTASSDACELSLGHEMTGDETERAYKREKLMPHIWDERQKLMAEWAAFVDTPPTVIPFPIAKEKIPA